MTTVTRADRRHLSIVLAVLFTVGWATNHFVAMMPVLHDRSGISNAALEAAFGIYAVGLLPGLLTGGGISDRVGRKPIVLPGATGAALGNLLMLVWHTEPGVLIGRFAVGLGVGLAVSAGTAWCADLGGQHGTVFAGGVLTSGFAIGPLVSGLIAQFTDSAAILVPFTVTVVASLVAVAAGITVPNVRRTPPDQQPAVTSDAGRSLGRALWTSIPMSLWVFSAITLVIVTMTGRMTAFSGPWVPGVAAVLALGSGVVAQVFARSGMWGPRTGISGALLVAAGMAVVAIAGSSPAPAEFIIAAVLLGSGYGLCLREGLVDVETYAPAARRGLAIGVFYVGTYLGFGLPLVLRGLAPTFGITAPIVVLAILAALSAALRAGQLRTGVLDR
ncbi:MFS transporter [Gordonia hydrophobica]|uniref:MFS transporter n=1 Tax=Gordonia hydrophobica TaxID=40516 RepID=A0ABZ2TY87_9ACTN|nr:MFS transporter [Gordonia hydrophobica]MBM7366536.1 putative MFS family arabinose efflux permease [Gordonia hydrophobica]